MSIEVWKPVTTSGYENLYQVSDHGRARGPRGLLKPWVGNQRGSLYITMGRNTKRLLHRLILEAFVGPCPNGLVGCHWDDDPANNFLSNLRWDTEGGNARDKVRNGNHHYAKRAHCKYGHEYTPENTRVRERNGTRSRVCLTCQHKYNQSYCR